jgi:hypothetical protein
MSDDKHAERLLRLRADIAAEYSLDASNWQVKRLALLMSVHSQSEDMIANGRSVDVSALLALDKAIEEVRAALRAAEPVQVNVHFVEGVTGVATVTCPCGCGHTWRHEFAPGTYTAVETGRRAPPEPAVVEKVVLPAPPPAPDLSRLHYGSDNGSGNNMGAVYGASAGNNIRDLWRNDPNPNRRNGA